MKINLEIIISSLFILFILCIIGLTSETVLIKELSILGLITVFIILILYALEKLFKNRSEAIMRFKNQHIIIQILDILSIILLIFNIITLKYFDITGIIIGLSMFATLWEWLKKED